jgi:hypothetical protein
MFVNATTLDQVRIECIGEARAVTMPGMLWIEVLDKMRALHAETEATLTQLDELAAVWGDEGVFRRCRDRLRKAVEDARLYRQGD